MGPKPGEYDATRLLGELDTILADAAQATYAGHDLWTAWFDATERAEERDYTHGHTANLLLHWIMGGQVDLQTITAAQALLADANDPRRAQVQEVARRLEAADVTWDEHANATKKALIRRPRPAPEPVPANALPLADADAALVQALPAGADLETLVRAFAVFAKAPFAPPAPLSCEEDRCLFDWSGEEIGLVRQFVLYDDSDYDHIEHVRAALRLPGFSEAVTVWGSEDVDAWVQDVVGLPPFAAAARQVPEAVEVVRYDG